MKRRGREGEVWRQKLGNIGLYRKRSFKNANRFTNALMEPFRYVSNFRMLDNQQQIVVNPCGIRHIQQCKPR